ncbi:hypothetical protein [Microbispora sp. H10949]|uniref:hypothetical protein n=1 Tax=Microbispora sp. H10949 TaxID=2729111 RepID=UPI002175F984|nr:hypothetical protein [Microbispora sp. H10949]
MLERLHSSTQTGRIRDFLALNGGVVRTKFPGGFQAHHVRVRPHLLYRGEREATGRDTTEAGHDPNAGDLDARPPKPDDRLDHLVLRLTAQ